MKKILSALFAVVILFTFSVNSFSQTIDLKMMRLKQIPSSYSELSAGLQVQHPRFSASITLPFSDNFRLGAYYNPINNFRVQESIVIEAQRKIGNLNKPSYGGLWLGIGAMTTYHEDESGKIENQCWTDDFGKWARQRALR